MDIDDLTIREAKKLVKIFGQQVPNDANPFNNWIGKNVFIRTVTMIQVGKLDAVYANELVLSNAAWIADTGYFADALRNPEKLDEIEPWPDGKVIIGRKAIIDVCLWTHALLRSVKGR